MVVYSKFFKDQFIGIPLFLGKLGKFPSRPNKIYNII